MSSTATLCRTMNDTELEVGKSASCLTPACYICLGLAGLQRAFTTRYSEVTRSSQAGCISCKWVATALYRQGYCELVVSDRLVEVSRAIDNSVQIWESDSAKNSEELIGIEIFTPAGMFKVFTISEHLTRCLDFLFARLVPSQSDHGRGIPSLAWTRPAFRSFDRL